MSWSIANSLGPPLGGTESLAPLGAEDVVQPKGRVGAPG
jgi:hypothetical protein